MRTPCIIEAKTNTPILLFLVVLPQLIGSESKKQAKQKEIASARVVYHETSKCHEEEETVNFSGALKMHAVSFSL